MHFVGEKRFRIESAICAIKRRILPDDRVRHTHVVHNERFSQCVDIMEWCCDSFELAFTGLDGLPSCWRRDIN